MPMIHSQMGPRPTLTTPGRVPIIDETREEDNKHNDNEHAEIVMSLYPPVVSVEFFSFLVGEMGEKHTVDD